VTPFDWGHYLDLAQEIFDDYDKADDAAMRSVVSRAYYAAFNLALALLNSKDITFSPTKNSHEEVWKAFTEGPNSVWKTVGKTGDKLRWKRNDADYHLITKDPVKWSEEARYTIQQAERIIASLDTIAQQKPADPSQR
jgi:uncharacterized protein (UPF0332 family)